MSVEMIDDEILIDGVPLDNYIENQFTMAGIPQNRSSVTIGQTINCGNTWSGGCTCNGQCRPQQPQTLRIEDPDPPITSTTRRVDKYDDLPTWDDIAY